MWSCDTRTASLSEALLFRMVREAVAGLKKVNVERQARIAVPCTNARSCDLAIRNVPGAKYEQHMSRRDAPFLIHGYVFRQL